MLIDCELVAVDAVKIAKDYLVPCIAAAHCAVNGCFWRRWHNLAPSKFALKVDPERDADYDPDYG